MRAREEQCLWKAFAYNEPKVKFVRRQIAGAPVCLARAIPLPLHTWTDSSDALRRRIRERKWTCPVVRLRHCLLAQAHLLVR